MPPASMPDGGWPALKPTGAPPAAAAANPYASAPAEPRRGGGAGPLGGELFPGQPQHDPDPLRMGPLYSRMGLNHPPSQPWGQQPSLNLPPVRTTAPSPGAAPPTSANPPPAADPPTGASHPPGAMGPTGGAASTNLARVGSAGGLETLTTLQDLNGDEHNSVPPASPRWSGEEGTSGNSATPSSGAATPSGMGSSATSQSAGDARQQPSNNGGDRRSGTSSRTSTKK